MNSKLAHRQVMQGFHNIAFPNHRAQIAEGRVSEGIETGYLLFFSLGKGIPAPGISTVVDPRPRERPLLTRQSKSPTQHHHHYRHKPLRGRLCNHILLALCRERAGEKAHGHLREEAWAL